MRGQPVSCEEAQELHGFGHQTRPRRPLSSTGIEKGHGGDDRELCYAVFRPKREYICDDVDAAVIKAFGWMLKSCTRTLQATLVS